MLFGTDYVKKEANVLDKIVDTLDQLDTELSTLDENVNQRERESAQRRAVAEIEKFAKQTEKLEDIQNKKDSVFEDEANPEDYARTNQALRDIEAACDNLHATMEDLTVNDIDMRNYMAIEDTMREIRQILKTVGRYDNAQEESNDYQLHGN